jgi:hypothetical protein
MNKYETLLTDVFSVFNATQWKSENIKTVPSNYVVSDIDSEYIRVTVLPSEGGINRQSVSGLLLIDIFTVAGAGPGREMAIADTLDNHLVGKSKFTKSNSRTQFGSSNLARSGVDQDNPTLYRSNYSIPFNYFEAQI